MLEAAATDDGEKFWSSSVVNRSCIFTDDDGDDDNAHLTKL